LTSGKEGKKKGFSKILLSFSGMGGKKLSSYRTGEKKDSPHREEKELPLYVSNK